MNRSSLSTVLTVLGIIFLFLGVIGALGMLALPIGGFRVLYFLAVLFSAAVSGATCMGLGYAIMLLEDLHEMQRSAPMHGAPEKPSQPPKPKAADPAPNTPAPEVITMQKPTGDEIICPHCGCRQKSDRKLCWKCGAVFQYAEEAADR